MGKMAHWRGEGKLPDSCVSFLWWQLPCHLSLIQLAWAKGLLPVERKWSCGRLLCYRKARDLTVPLVPWLAIHFSSLLMRRWETGREASSVQCSHISELYLGQCWGEHLILFRVCRKPVPIFYLQGHSQLLPRMFYSDPLDISWPTCLTHGSHQPTCSFMYSSVHCCKCVLQGSSQEGRNHRVLGCTSVLACFLTAGTSV